MLVMLSALCFSAYGAGSGGVPFSDLSTNPIVRIDWPRMTLTLPPSNAASVGSVLPKVRIEGSNILITAQYVLRNKPATTTFNLKKLGMKPDKAASARVFWLDPGGSRKELEIASSKTSQK